MARLTADHPSEPPLCLLSHIDVVTAEGSKWPPETQPMSGAIWDGIFWGRGTLDMKGLGALELMTVIWLKRLKALLKRDVVFVAVADEEVGDHGMTFMVDKHWDRLKCGHLINEGGIGLKDLLFDGQTVFPISVAEKGLLWLRIIASGPAGHGSMPIPVCAPERLLNARPIESQIDSSLYAILREVGDNKGGAMGFVLARPFLVDTLARGRLMANPAARAGITNTCQVTGFSGGFEPNVIPSEVTATVDCRLLPGVKPDDMLDELKRVVADDHVRFEVIQAAESNGSSWDDPVFEILARHAIDGRPDVTSGPVLSPGYTDSLDARPKGTRAYGFVPFAITTEEAATMHGDNERVSVENVHHGLKILLEAVAEIAGAE